MDFDQRNVELTIVTTQGYTVYDPDYELAYVQIKRGPDNVTLHGMNMMIEFYGATYLVTLPTPAPGGSKTYMFNMTSMNGELPGEVSVAPVFILDGRQVLGKITSRIMMPIMKFAKSQAEIETEFGEAEEVVVMVEGVEELDLIKNCPNGVERDPFKDANGLGGCPIASGTMVNMRHTAGGKLFEYTEPRDSTWAWDGVNPTHFVQFFGDGSCIEEEKMCVGIKLVAYSSSSGYNTTSIIDGTPLTSGTKTCSGTNKFYIYKNNKCR